MSPTYLAEGTLGDSYLNYVEPALSEKGPSEPVVLQKNRDFQIKKIGSHRKVIFQGRKGKT